MSKVILTPLQKTLNLEYQYCYQNRRNVSHTAPMAKTIGKTILPLEIELGELLVLFKGEDVGGGGGFSTSIASFIPP